MANPLTNRQRAKAHTKESNAFDKMARLQLSAANSAYSLLGPTSTIEDWAAAIALFEKAHAYDRESDAHDAQAAAWNAAADAAGEPA